MKDDICIGCLNPVLHKFCPAHGSPLYCLSLREGPKVVYSDKIHKARNLSKLIHKNQKRWSGASYFEEHINGVVKNAIGLLEKLKFCLPEDKEFNEVAEKVVCLAYLHDTLEDCEADDALFLSENLQKDFSDILPLIEVLTRSKDVPYCDYIVDISKSYLECCIVKLADLDHNSIGLDKSKDRYSKYRLSHELISRTMKGFLEC